MPMKENIIAVLVILLIVALAACYVIRQKKRGAKCIGCPAGCNCGKQGKNGCCGGCKQDT